MNGNITISKDDVLRILTEGGYFIPSGVKHTLINVPFDKILSDVMRELIKQRDLANYYRDRCDQLESEE